MRPLRECSDEDLLTVVIADGDRVAFAALVERYEAMVLRVCMGVLHHRQDVEAARQETCLVLWQKAGSIQAKRKFESWLRGVAHFEALRIWKNRQRRRKHESLCDVDDQSQITQITQITQQRQPFDVAALHEREALLREELQSLNTKYRVPLVLCYLEGKNKDEIAADLGWPVGTVSNRLARGRQLLRKRLARYGLAPSGDQD